MRRLLHSLALLAMVAAPALPVAADFPEKPIAIVVPFGAGDAIDGTARVMADQLSDELGVPVIVKNIAGAGGGKGTAEAAKAEPDGYTLLMASTGATTARPLISADAGYQTDDFVPLAQLVEVPIGLAVAADSAFQSIEDMIEAAKASPGAVKYATPGPGSTQHINMERFAGEQGIELTHIGGQGGKGAVTKALSGEVDFVFVGASNYTSLADAGKLRVLGIAAPEPVAYLPDAPTFRSEGYDFYVAVWFGLVTNSGTPEETVETLRAAIEKVAQADATQELYQKFNFESAFLDAEAFGERIQENVAMHGEVLKEIGLIQ
jgi:tripartite-type tricarboxylate transporter receptor subunit TctC